MSLLDALIASGLVIYPLPEVQRRLFMQSRNSPHYPHRAEVQDGAVARAGSGPIGGEPAWGRGVDPGL
jgi:hypothetical protein